MAYYESIVYPTSQIGNGNPLKMLMTGLMKVVGVINLRSVTDVVQTQSRFYGPEVSE